MKQQIDVMRLHRVLLIALVGCAAAQRPPARQEEMSAAEHEAAAREEERQAAAHAAGFDPEAKVLRMNCGASLPDAPICWTQAENPTEWQLRAAEGHRKHAASHRAASATLRDAEARACVGVTGEDRDISPFARIDDIASVEAVYELIDRAPPRVIGAAVRFHRRPGLTVATLQRLVDCHLAHNAAVGHVVPELSSCPLVPQGVTARVWMAPAGVVVTIESTDPAVAREVLSRARRLIRPLEARRTDP